METAAPPMAGSTASSSLEQERYYSALVAATPLLMGNYSPHPHHPSSIAGGDSLTSLDSLLLTELTTPDAQRRGAGGGAMARAVSSLRSSGGKARSKHTHRHDGRQGTTAGGRWEGEMVLAWDFEDESSFL